MVRVKAIIYVEDEWEAESFGLAQAEAEEMVQDIIREHGCHAYVKTVSEIGGE